MVQLTNLLQPLFAWISARFAREEGQDFVEYAVILGVVVVAAVAAYITIGKDINTVLGDVTTALTNAVTAA